MTTYSFVSTDLAKPRATESVKYDLTIRQQPEQAKVCTTKERDRRPIDPPPVIQIHVVAENGQVPHYLQNPHLFMCATLVHATDDQPLARTQSTTLAGTTVSSLYRLKDSDNSDGGFFVFADTSVRMEGSFRLQLSLFELKTTPGLLTGSGQQVSHLASICTQPFTVFSSKGFPGMLPSTFLSKSFSDQGVRIRIRKENRMQMKLCDDSLASQRREGLADQESELMSFSTSRSADTAFLYSPQSADVYHEPYGQTSGISPTSSSCPSRSERLSPKAYHPYMFQPVSPKLVHHNQNQQRQQMFQEPLKSASKHHIWRPTNSRSSISPRDASTGFHGVESNGRHSRELPNSYIAYGDNQSSNSPELSRRVSSNSTKSAVLPSPPDHFRHQHSGGYTSTSVPHEFDLAPMPSSGHKYEKMSLHGGYGYDTFGARGQTSDDQMRGGTSVSSRPRLYNGLGIADGTRRSYAPESQNSYGPPFKSFDNDLSRPNIKQAFEASSETGVQINHNLNETGLRLPPIHSSIGELPFQSSERQPYFPATGTSMNHVYRY